MRFYLTSLISLFFFSQSASAQSSADAATINNSTSKRAASTGSLTEPIEQLKLRPSKWSTSAYIGNWGSVTAFDGGPKNETYTDFYVEQKKDIGNGQSLGVRVHAQMYERSDENTDKVVMADPQIIYRNRRFASTTRLSFPVLDQSRLVGQHELRWNGGADLLKSGRFSATLLLEARGYGYSKDDDGQLMARTRNGVGLTYSVSDRISPFFNALYDVRWSHGGEGTTILNKNDEIDPSNLGRFDWFDLGASMVLVPKHLNFDVYVTQVRAYDSNTAFLSRDDTGYNFELSATF